MIFPPMIWVLTYKADERIYACGLLERATPRNLGTRRKAWRHPGSEGHSRVPLPGRPNARHGVVNLSISGVRDLSVNALPRGERIHARSSITYFSDRGGRLQAGDRKTHLLEMPKNALSSLNTRLGERVPTKGRQAPCVRGAWKSSSNPPVGQALGRPRSPE